MCVRQLSRDDDDVHRWYIKEESRDSKDMTKQDSKYEKKKKAVQKMRTSRRRIERKKKTTHRQKYLYTAELVRGHSTNQNSACVPFASFANPFRIEKKGRNI